MIDEKEYFEYIVSRVVGSSDDTKEIQRCAYDSLIDIIAYKFCDNKPRQAEALFMSWYRKGLAERELAEKEDLEGAELE